MHRGRGHHRGPGGHGDPAHPRRIRGFVEPALLLLLHQGDTHGYDLASGLEGVGLDQYPVDPSTVYRVLRRLEHRGMILSAWDTEGASGPPRRVYRLTEEGREYLTAWVADLRATDDMVHRFLGAYDRTFPAESSEAGADSRAQYSD